ncbi:hypothetical protein [Pseudoclavibacter sp. RFBG4]|uniref:hypothetical protein n=1 Tax=Pseudoclavibacter sp. RFBG4 TaxID=2080575 RepID=UPI0011B05F53|nr:hypothetical protein [Pseudoclavibacter sp. RFBG4]
MRKFAVPLLGSALIVLTSACSPGAGNESSESVAGLWASPEEEEFSALANPKGTLTRDDSGCWGLAVESGAGSNFYVARFPYETHLTSDQAGVELPDGRVFSEGDLVDGTGGFASGSTREELIGLPEICSPDQVVFLSQID